MLVRNGTSRWQLAIEALRRAHGISSRAASLIERYARMLDDDRAFIERHGFTPPELAEWRFSSS